MLKLIAVLLALSLAACSGPAPRVSCWYEISQEPPGAAPGTSISRDVERRCVEKS